MNNMGRTNTKKIVKILASTMFIVGCSKKSEEVQPSAAAAKGLYVASGQCYSGSGITTYGVAQASAVITRWNISTGASEGIYSDLRTGANVFPGTLPQAMIDRDDHILLLTENATISGDRTIVKIDKSDPTTYTKYASDATAFTMTATHITRAMSLDADGTMHFSKSLMTERLSSLGVRLTKAGANPWVNPLAATGNCFGAAAAQIQDIAHMAPYTNTNQGKLIYIHAGATAATNIIGVVQRTGMTSATAGDCAGATAGGASTVIHTNATGLSGPVSFVATGASLTSMVYIPTPTPALTTGVLLVSYSSSVNTAFDNTTNFNYGIVKWNITETSDTAVTVNSPVIIYRDQSVVWAPSAMAYDADTSSLYVAVGGSPGLMNQTTQNYGYNIEKFTVDLSTPSLTRVHTGYRPFIEGNETTKCISDMIIGY
jgi:hypothetical protein